MRAPVLRLAEGWCPDLRHGQLAPRAPTEVAQWEPWDGPWCPTCRACWRYIGDNRLVLRMFTPAPYTGRLDLWVTPEFIEDAYVVALDAALDEQRRKITRYCEDMDGRHLTIIVADHLPEDPNG